MYTTKMRQKYHSIIILRIQIILLNFAYLKDSDFNDSLTNHCKLLETVT
jgi:hypothetical protein